MENTYSIGTIWDQHKPAYPHKHIHLPSVDPQRPLPPSFPYDCHKCLYEFYHEPRACEHYHHCPAVEPHPHVKPFVPTIDYPFEDREVPEKPIYGPQPVLFNKIEYKGEDKQLVNKHNKIIFKDMQAAYEEIAQKDLLPAQAYLVYYYDSTSESGISCLCGIGNIKDGAANIVFVDSTIVDKLNTKVEELTARIEALENN